MLHFDKSILPLQHPPLRKDFSEKCRTLNLSSSLLTFKSKALVNVNVMIMYVHELTTAILLGYFNAILKECIGKTLWQKFYIFRYVTDKT